MNDNIDIHADHYVASLMREQDRKYAFQANNLNEIEKWQKEFRQELLKILGIDKIKKRGLSDLDPKCIDMIKLDDHIREEWRITSEPGYIIPFFLLRPLKQTEPLPLIITPHGHGKYGKDTYVGIAHSKDDERSMKEGERDIALQAVREGYIAIAMDQRGFAGSRFKEDIIAGEKYSCRKMQMHAMLFGRTLIGERVWDVSRIIDFAETNKDIDDKHIAVTGNSGGGTTTLFSAAVDTRISAAIPGSYFCTFEHSIGSVHHCECNYIPGIMTLGEMYDVAGLIAPRPFLAVAGREDAIFPLNGVKIAYNELYKVYKTAGLQERCELYIGDGGHRYYKARVWPFHKKMVRLTA